MTKGSKLTLYFCTYFKYGRYQFATNLLPFFGKTRQPSHKKSTGAPSQNRTTNRSLPWIRYTT